MRVCACAFRVFVVTGQARPAAGRMVVFVSLPTLKEELEPCTIHIGCILEKMLVGTDKDGTRVISLLPTPGALGFLGATVPCLVTWVT